MPARDTAGAGDAPAEGRRPERPDTECGSVMMNVRTLCLAILHSGDATGYEIKKLSVEGRYSYFVDASFGSIYPALARLEADGLVTVREEVQSGKPARKVYSITPAGRAELVAQLSVPPAPDVFRSEFLLVAMNAELVDGARLREAIAARRKHLSDEISHLETVARDSDHPGARWIARYGIACMQASLAFLDANSPELETLAADAAGDAAGDALARVAAE